MLAQIVLPLHLLDLAASLVLDLLPKSQDFGFAYQQSDQLAELFLRRIDFQQFLGVLQIDALEIRDRVDRLQRVFQRRDGIDQFLRKRGDHLRDLLELVPGVPRQRIDLEALLDLFRREFDLAP